MNPFSTRLFHFGLALATASTLVVTLLLGLAQVQTADARPLQTPAFDQFTINFGDTVSDGVPGPGAGNIEAPGEVDVYNFDAVAGQQAIFNWLSGSNVLFGWRLQAPDGAALFDSFLRDWQLPLPQSGTYTLTVDANNGNSTGLYSFQLLEAPVPQQFTINIGDTVSEDIPAAGAGNLEAPGAVDVYRFDGLTGQEVIFDWLSGSNVLLGWQLQAPDGAVLFDTVLQDHQLSLLQSGVYTLNVDGNGVDDFGLYSFRLLGVAPAPQHFAIAFGDTVSDGVPAAGAGNLEAPGAIDVYTFDALARQEAVFDWLSGSNVSIGWHLQGPDGAVLFDTVLQDHQLSLPQSGVYTLTVDGNSIDAFGAYSFALLEDIAPSWRSYVPLFTR